MSAGPDLAEHQRIRVYGVYQAPVGLYVAFALPGVSAPELMVPVAAGEGTPRGQYRHGRFQFAYVRAPLPNPLKVGVEPGGLDYPLFEPPFGVLGQDAGGRLPFRELDLPAPVGLGLLYGLQRLVVGADVHAYAPV